MFELSDDEWRDVDLMFTREHCPLANSAGEYHGFCGSLYRREGDRWVKDCTMLGLHGSCGLKS
jgi:hypothetical protein